MSEGGGRWVLDSYAIMAWLANEPGSDQVARVLTTPSASLYMSAINVGEVYYLLCRRRGRDQAREVEGVLYDHPRVRIAEAGRDRVRAAGDIKALGRLSLADAFAAALALELDAVLLTGDSEFRPLESARSLRVEWMGATQLSDPE